MQYNIVKDNSETYLLAYYDRWIHNFERMVAGGLKAESTLRKHKVVYKKIAQFLKEEMEVRDLPLLSIQPSFIINFHLFLKQTCKLAHNTIWNYLTPVQMLLHKAYQQGIVPQYPFADYHNHMEDTDRTYLAQEELNCLQCFPFDSTPKRAYLRDLFVFCCYTGLAYIDLKRLRKENIVRNPIDHQLWIHTYRKKTGTEVNVKLLPIALDILSRRCTKKSSEYVFDVPSLAACNKMLKTITKKCNLHKHITWHAARHTMVTVICLSNNMSIEVVGTLLGHKNIRSTQIYAKITKQKLSLEMDTLCQRLKPQAECTERMLQSSFPNSTSLCMYSSTPVNSSASTTSSLSSTAESVDQDMTAPQNLNTDALTPSTADACTIQRSTRMTTAHMAALLHAPLRSVESTIMELTGAVNASAQYAPDTMLAVALLLDTSEAQEFVKSIRKRIKGKK